MAAIKKPRGLARGWRTLELFPVEDDARDPADHGDADEDVSERDRVDELHKTLLKRGFLAGLNYLR